MIVEITSASNITGLKRGSAALGSSRQWRGRTVCRWLVEGVKIDVMPGRKHSRVLQPLVFRCLEVCETTNITDDLDIRLVTAPYFLATKMEAFLAGVEAITSPAMIWRTLSP